MKYEFYDIFSCRRDASMSYLEKPLPPDMKATCRCKLERVFSDGSNLEHLVAVSSVEKYRLQRAFYDVQLGLWWSRHPISPSVAAMTWEGKPPQKLPKRIRKLFDLDLSCDP
jgi:hypothetical protein